MDIRQPRQPEAPPEPRNVPILLRPPHPIHAPDSTPTPPHPAHRVPDPARHRHHRPPRRGRAAAWRPGALLGLAGALFGVTLFSAGAAFAYFLTTDSSNPAVAAAATLSAPGSGQQNGKDKAGAVAISWTAPGGYTPTGYTVSRCAGPSCTSFTPVTSGNCANTLHKTSCYEVTAALDNWTSSASVSFQGTTAGATTMTFTSQPAVGAQIQAAGTGTFDVSVTVQDANGSTVTTDSTDSVTLAIDGSHNLGNGTLTCTGGLSVGVNKGVATFKNCTIDKAGTGYQLTASSSNTALAPPGNANSFSIVAGKPSQFTATAGGGHSANTSAAFGKPLSATLQDSDYYPGTSTLMVTLGTMSKAGTVNQVASSVVQLNLSTGIPDTGDNALTGYTHTTGSVSQF